MSSLNETLVAFTRRHPALGGVALIAVGILMVRDSVESAREFRELERARELPAQVMSIADADVLLPRFDVTVAWVEMGSVTEGTIRVGPKAAEKLQVGDAVQILIRENGGSITLASFRHSQRPVSVAGMEAMPLAYAGIGMCAFGAIIALFGKRLL